VTAFLVVLAVTLVPFYLLGSSDGSSESFLGLAPSALMFVCPAVAALVVTARRGRATAAVAWAGSVLRIPPRGPRIWLVGAVTTMPAVILVAGVLRHGDLAWLGAVSPASTALYAVLFLVTGLAEQLGWTGYVRPRLLRRWSWPQCSILIGLCWAAIHVIPWAQTGHHAYWIAGQSLFTVGLRLVMDFYVERLGADVVTSTVCQASSNVAWMNLLDATGAYDPVVTGGVTAAVAALLVGIDRRWPGRRGSCAPSEAGPLS
jgi:hypothetical protein